ncbi:unnamed protein product [Rotaria socialis]|uniref:Phosphoenolpyruvate carboxykinase, cytosolic [GTP] n=1 Tax=Rotaria socialis TaxID=392032 RepID=A0A817MB79_9BILA|nr:unnamed protein product [Rotaria socialis]CAF3321337.1 unnamed protein product [Rotaria socialis]CAF4237568.1 unnamed protein product [Rotaria socialis]
MEAFLHANNNLDVLPSKIREYVEEKIKLCQPSNFHVCNGSDEENQQLLDAMELSGVIRRLRKYKNCYIATTDPRDVARVESRTVICTKNMNDIISTPKSGFAPITDPNLPKNLKATQLGNWMDTDEMLEILEKRFAGCMCGRTLYIIPYMMGPYSSPYSKIAVELTDSPYVVASMRIMTRMGANVFNEIKTSDGSDVVKCLHSIGVPLPTDKQVNPTWPCNPEQTLVTHFPERNEIISFGSGYGGNSLCGKKCLALRIGSSLAKREGWLAEHMLIMGVTNPEGVKKYFVAAFPSACGKTNLAMLRPVGLPGYKVECVGDDIAWMHFDDEGRLRAINPEFGFFGVAPGTSKSTNPIALDMVHENTIFTNVAETSNGDVYWEGIGEVIDGLHETSIRSWKNKRWSADLGEPAAHPNSRFCTTIKQCSILDPEWNNPQGVPIEAIIFGGRRPEGVPLVYEAFDWQHGVFVGACMRSEATAAAEFKGKQIMHDPFAMRPFFGYNFGSYLAHWLSFGAKTGVHLPKIYHVNWFLRDSKTNEFLWPGFGENIRVIDWIFRRLTQQASGCKTPIGIIPDQNVSNGILGNRINPALLDISKEFWINECKAIRNYLEENVNKDLPDEICSELNNLEKRLSTL